jgi:tripartite-type tricarboxylate transporter receptor subunit TctC
MKYPRRTFLQLAASAAALTALPRRARSQAWPDRIVRIVVGLPAGGGSDTVARILANRLSEVWGQQVIVENKSGAGGNLAFEAVAHAAPDGNTILLATRAPALNRFLYSRLTYDPDADLAPVTLVGRFPYLLVVPNSSPAKTLQGFISHAKANPGKLTFATSGVGGGPHLAAELLKRMAGIEMTHVPYRGVAAGALSDLMADRVDAMFNALASLLPPVRAGQVRGLAVTTAARFESVPDIPTFAESGVPGFDAAAWYGLFVPAKTPPEIVGKINSDTVALLAQAAVKEKFVPLGTAVVGSTQGELAATAKADVERLGPIIKALNLAG